MKDMQRMFYATEAWGQKSKWVKATSLHRYADLIQGWEESWRRRWALPRRDQLWNDRQWQAGECQRRSWKMQHSDEKNAKSNAVEILYGTSSTCSSWHGGENFFGDRDQRWNMLQNLNPPWMKETMNEEATTVQAKQPPSSFKLIFRWNFPNLTYVSRNTTWIAGKSQSSYFPLLLSPPLLVLVLFGEVIQRQMDNNTFNTAPQVGLPYMGN